MDYTSTALSRLDSTSDATQLCLFNIYFGCGKSMRMNCACKVTSCSECSHDINLTCESFIILVTSGWILFAMPKSISFSEAFTMTKFAGFKSLWTIPAQKTYLELLENLIILVFQTTRRIDDGLARAIEKENRVCGWFGQPPACSSSRTSSPADSQLCGFATTCSDPSFHTPSPCRCSCCLFHCKHIYNHHDMSNRNHRYKNEPLYIII